LHTIDVAGEAANYHGTTDLQTPKLSGADVAMEDYFFTPTVVVGVPETEIELTLRNEGTATHNFSIEDLDIDTDVPAGEARTLSLPVPRIGGYVFFCKYFAASGMRGAINNPSEPAPTATPAP